MSELLLELFSDEIPARMQAKACEDLARLMLEALEKSTLSVGAYKTYVTPRRLTLHLTGMASATFASDELRRGPRVDAPEKAIEGFLKSTGLTRDQLIQQDEGKGTFFYAKIDTPSRSAAAVIADVVPTLIRSFPWPKSMRWGAASTSMDALRWVRPLHSILCVLDGVVVPFEVDGIISGNTTRGHRFMAAKTPPPQGKGDRPAASLRGGGAVTPPSLAPTSTAASPPPPKGRSPSPSSGGGALIEHVSSFADYQQKLLEHHVVLDSAIRAEHIWQQATALATAAGLTVVEDKALLAENAGLTEWPVPLLGTFDANFLDVPPEVIQLTMRTNQKYFALRDKAGKLSNHFMCVANIAASDDGAAIVAGNQRVLAARLSDAKFFWEQDKKTRLAAHAEKLKTIVFHEKLGTVADKVERVAKLARWLVEKNIVKGASADEAETAARLCKADLVTGMVGEFPELQGVMGGYYARAQGLPDAVADAIRDHYKPVGQGDDVPTAPVIVAVSLADKLDTLVGFFGVGEIPTGSKDPFALRRAALGAIRLIIQNDIRLDIAQVLAQIYLMQVDQRKQLGLSNELIGGVAGGVVHIVIIDRLKVQQREAGVRHDLIDAVFALGNENDLVRLLARVHALQAFITTDDGINLLAGYRRAANILKIEEKKDNRQFDAVVDADTLATQEEKILHTAITKATHTAQQAVDTEDFTAAMSALAALRAPIDQFFDTVMVNDPAHRDNRLNLLAAIRTAVHTVADFSKIEK